MSSKILFTLIALLMMGTLASSETYTIKVKSGAEAQLPSSFALGEPAMTNDTYRVFFGTGAGKVELLSTPLVQRSNEPENAPKLQVIDKTGKVRMTIDATGALVIR